MLISYFHTFKESFLRLYYQHRDAFVSHLQLHRFPGRLQPCVGKYAFGQWWPRPFAPPPHFPGSVQALSVGAEDRSTKDLNLFLKQTFRASFCKSQDKHEELWHNLNFHDQQEKNKHSFSKHLPQNTPRPAMISLGTFTWIKEWPVRSPAIVKYSQWIIMQWFKDE